MKFYKRDPDRALAGMAELTFEQRGAYNSLLDLLYSRDGNVPDDDERVARMLSCNKREWVRLKKSLIELGKVWVEDGKIAARRVQETINEATEFSNKQRANAKSRWVKSENTSENNGATVPHGNSTPAEIGNALTATATPTPIDTATASPTPSSAAHSGADDQFDLVEQTIRSIPGIDKHPVATMPSIGPIWSMVKDGWDLKTEIVPAIRTCLARAKQPIRTWKYFVDHITEQRAATPKPPPPEPASDKDWRDRLDFARGNKTWDSKKWGPFPNQPGCLAPAALVQPGDGKGWTEWAERKRA